MRWGLEGAEHPGLTLAAVEGPTPPSESSWVNTREGCSEPGMAQGPREAEWSEAEMLPVSAGRQGLGTTPQMGNRPPSEI